MNKIYIVMGSQGEYDSHTEWPEIAFFDQNQATTHADQLNQEVDNAKAGFEILWEQSSQWETKNPRPDSLYPNKSHFKGYLEWNEAYRQNWSDNLDKLNLTPNERKRVDNGGCGVYYIVVELEIR